LSTWTTTGWQSTDVAERRPPELRREAILDAAIRLVARKGFAAVTLRDVAGEVGVAHGLLRHYFASRDQLLASAFDRAVAAELATTCDLDGDPRVALASWLAATPREYYLVWIDAWSEAPRNAALLTALTRHHLACERRLLTIIERGVHDLAFETTSPGDTARILTALADGLAVQHHALGVIDGGEYDGLVYTQAERLLALPPGSLASAARRASAVALKRGEWLAG
jgi:AcrR family transcriptional regulator